MRFAKMLVVSALFVFAIAAADMEDGVLEIYNGSSELPDSIAFGAFLDLVHATREKGNGSDGPIISVLCASSISNAFTIIRQKYLYR